VLNGIGAINLQLFVALAGAIINIPLSIFLAKYCGLGSTGVCLATVFGFMAGAIAFTVQVNCILKKNISQSVVYNN
jgi:Na+-driven multidrug efflux pump